MESKGALRAMALCGVRRDDFTVLTKQGHKYAKYEMSDGYLKTLMLFRDSFKADARKRAAQRELEDMKSPSRVAVELFTRGRTVMDRRVQELSMLALDRSEKKYARFRNAILSIYKYLNDREMRLETFQLELLRGTVIGVAWNQLRDDLFKYKHEILDLLGLATPEIRSYNYRSPDPDTMRHIDALCDLYNKPYTLGMAPRQSGKTTIMSLILASVVLFLDITVVVLAQNKNMAETIQTNMMAIVGEFEAAPWFKTEWKSIEGRGTVDTRVFTFNPEYKGPSKISFLSSSPNVSMASHFYIFLESARNPVIALASHPAFPEAARVYVLGLGKTSTSVVITYVLTVESIPNTEALLGLDVLRSPTSVVVRCERNDAIDVALSTIGDVTTLPDYKRYVKGVVCFEFSPDEARYEKAYAAETEIYQRLLDEGVDACFNGPIFRHYVDECGLPDEITEATLSGVSAAKKYIEDAFGTDLGTRDPSITKCSRSLTCPDTDAESASDEGPSSDLEPSTCIDDDSASSASSFSSSSEGGSSPSPPAVGSAHGPSSSPFSLPRQHGDDKGPAACAERHTIPFPDTPFADAEMVGTSKKTATRSRDRGATPSRSTPPSRRTSMKTKTPPVRDATSSKKRRTAASRNERATKKRKRGVAPPRAASHHDGIRGLVSVINERMCVATRGPGFVKARLTPDVKFKDLSAYCCGTTARLSGLPERVEWHGVPFMLNDDSEAAKHKIYTYAVSDAHHVETSQTGAYSEVFLPGQAFSVINFDVDRPFDGTVPDADAAFAQTEDGSVARELLRVLADAASCYFPAEYAAHLKSLPLTHWGEVACYVRRGADKASLRLVWFPPLELCFPDVSALRRFLTNVKCTTSFFVKGSLDLQPYSTHKSCRLPNACKADGGRFEFAGTFNVAIPVARPYGAMSVGLSRQYVGLDRTSLGGGLVAWATEGPWRETPRSDGTRTAEMRWTSSSPTRGKYERVTKKRVDDVAGALGEHWGDVALTKISNDSVRVSPVSCAGLTCPIHERVHSNATFSATVTATLVFPYCFSDKNTPPIDFSTHYRVLEIARGAPLKITVRNRRVQKQ